MIARIGVSLKDFGAGRSILQRASKVLQKVPRLIKRAELLEVAAVVAECPEESTRGC